MTANLSRPCKLCSCPAAEATYRLASATVYCCPACDLHFIAYQDPPDHSSAPGRQLQDSDRQYIALRQDEGQVLHPLRLDLLRRHTRLDRIRLLDIGAGIGLFQKLAGETFNLDACGIEPSALRRQYAAEQLGISLIDKYVDDPWWQNSHADFFDVITLWDVIEHVNDPVSTLKQALNLLRPGGVLAIDTPDRQVLSYRLSEHAYRLTGGRLSLFLDSFYAAIPYGHKQIFTRPQLVTLLQDIGLQITVCQNSYQKNRRRGDKIILLAEKPSAEEFC